MRIGVLLSLALLVFTNAAAATENAASSPALCEALSEAFYTALEKARFCSFIPTVAVARTLFEADSTRAKSGNKPDEEEILLAIQCVEKLAQKQNSPRERSNAYLVLAGFNGLLAENYMKVVWNKIKFGDIAFDEVLKSRELDKTNLAALIVYGHAIGRMASHGAYVRGKIESHEQSSHPNFSLKGELMTLTDVIQKSLKDPAVAPDERQELLKLLGALQKRAGEI